MSQKQKTALKPNLPYFPAFSSFEKPALTETEQFLKQLMERHPEICTTLFASPAEFIDRYGLQNTKLAQLFHLTEESASENEFFEADFDVSVYRRMSYLPGILHSSDFMEIKYVYAGEALYHGERDVLQPLQTGDVLFVPVQHKFCVQQYPGQEPPVIINLMLRKSTFDQAFLHLLTPGDVLADFFSQTLYTPQQAVDYILFRCGEDPVIHHVMGLIWEEYFAELAYKEKMMNSYITQLMLLLLRFHEHHMCVPLAEVGEGDVADILYYIRKNFATATLQEMADHFNYSPRQMRRIIKSTTGGTFSELVKKQKLNKALELLRLPEVSMEEICKAAGFSDTGYFYRFFKENTGLTPGQYRERPELL